MCEQVTRRHFLNAAGATAAAASLSQVAQGQGGAGASSGAVRVVGLACSPRKGKTTATAVGAALEAARGVSGRVETELIDCGGLEFSGWSGGATPAAGKEVLDDFTAEVLPVLKGPGVGGLIIGSPVYFRSMSSLCKALLERLAVLRKPSLLLADKAVGALAVGGYRNGGQELVIEQITTAMLCHEVLVVGGKPRAHQGATLWNAYKDDITKDEFGMDTARKLGVRVAEVALGLAGG